MFSPTADFLGAPRAQPPRGVSRRDLQGAFKDHVATGRQMTPGEGSRRSPRAGLVGPARMPRRAGPRRRARRAMPWRSGLPRKLRSCRRKRPSTLTVLSPREEGAGRRSSTTGSSARDRDGEDGSASSGVDRALAEGSATPPPNASKRSSIPPGVLTMPPLGARKIADRWTNSPLTGNPRNGDRLNPGPSSRPESQQKGPRRLAATRPGLRLKSRKRSRFSAVHPPADRQFSRSAR